MKDMPPPILAIGGSGNSTHSGCIDNTAGSIPPGDLGPLRGGLIVGIGRGSHGWGASTGSFALERMRHLSSAGTSGGAGFDDFFGSGTSGWIFNGAADAIAAGCEVVVVREVL